MVKKDITDIREQDDDQASIQFIRERLEDAEKRGFTQQKAQEILEEIKQVIKTGK